MVRIKKQKVHLRRKKLTLPGKFSFKLKALSRFLASLLLLIGVGILLVRIKYLFVDSEYFIVKGIDTQISDDKGFLRNILLPEVNAKGIVGTSIFFIDLKNLNTKIESNHPELRDIVIRRLLPNKLLVQAKLRKSVAQLRSDRYYFVDSEGILLPDIKNFPDHGLPIISGVGVNIAKASRAKFSKFDKENLNKALGLIKEITDKKELSKYKLKLVDITDPGNITFFFNDANVEIKIGNSNFRDRLSLLVTVLDQIDSDINKFKYIDLRFEDPIIGPR